MVCSGGVDGPDVEADQDSFRAREVADDPPQGRRELPDQGGNGQDLVGAGQLRGEQEVNHLDGVAPPEVLLADPPEAVDRRQRPGRLAGHVEAKHHAFAHRPDRAIRLLDGLLIPFHGWTVLPWLPSARPRSTLRAAPTRASSRANPPSLSCSRSTALPSSSSSASSSAFRASICARTAARRWTIRHCRLWASYSRSRTSASSRISRASRAAPTRTPFVPT